MSSMPAVQNALTAARNPFRSQRRRRVNPNRPPISSSVARWSPGGNAPVAGSKDGITPPPSCQRQARMSTLMLSSRHTFSLIQGTGSFQFAFSCKVTNLLQNLSATASINAVVHLGRNRSVKQPSVPGRSSAVITSIDASKDSSLFRRRSIFSIA
jgi:hypothetical protein